MCVSTIGSYSTFGKTVNKHDKTQVESWVFGFSLIFDFPVYLKNSSRITFPPSGGGPCSRSLIKVLEGTGRPAGRAGGTGSRNSIAAQNRQSMSNLIYNIHKIYTYIYNI